MVNIVQFLIIVPWDLKKMENPWTVDNRDGQKSTAKKRNNAKLYDYFLPLVDEKDCNEEWTNNVDDIDLIVGRRCWIITSSLVSIDGKTMANFVNSKLVPS